MKKLSLVLLVGVVAIVAACGKKPAETTPVAEAPKTEVATPAPATEAPKTEVTTPAPAAEAPKTEATTPAPATTPTAPAAK